MEMCQVIMEKAKRMHALRITEEEMVAVLWLLMLRTGECINANRLLVHVHPKIFA